jgi:Spy/CpxP family protein refolding chaperone
MNMLTRVLILTALTATAAMAQPPGPRMGQGDGPKNKGPRPGAMADKLDLNQEQREQLKSLRQEAQQSMRPLQEALREARQATAKLIADENATSDEVMKSVVAEGAAYLALSKARAEHQIKVREIVGAEKAAQMLEMREEWREQRGGPRGPQNPQD